MTERERVEQTRSNSVVPSAGRGWWPLTQFEIGWSVASVPIPNKMTESTPFSSLSLQIPPSHPPPPLSFFICPELARLTNYRPMLSSHVTPVTRDAAYEEMSAQLATYSRTVFEFTLRLWSESRRRAEEIQKLEESTANFKLSLAPQVRIGSEICQ